MPTVGNLGRWRKQAEGQNEENVSNDVGILRIRDGEESSAAVNEAKREAVWPHPRRVEAG